MIKTRKSARINRVKRIRAKVNGNALRPRMTFFRSHLAIYTQLVDDEKSITLAGYKMQGKTKTEAEVLGQTVGEKLKDLGITSVVFDRRGYQYHGVVKSFVDAVRKAGISV